jgi:hypothetical protein
VRIETDAITYRTDQGVESWEIDGSIGAGARIGQMRVKGER